jgi:hypothetical protein
MENAACRRALLPGDDRQGAANGGAEARDGDATCQHDSNREYDNA